jgi:hypothetical protein
VPQGLLLREYDQQFARAGALCLIQQPLWDPGAVFLTAMLWGYRLTAYREADARRTRAFFASLLALFPFLSLLASFRSPGECLLEEVGRVKISNKCLSKSGRGEDGSEIEQRGRGMGDHHPGDPTGRLEAQGYGWLSAGPERRSSAICAI